MSEIATQPDPTELTTELAKFAAFVAPEPEIAGLKLRPLSAGSLIILKLTGNALIEGRDDAPDIEYHVASFLFIHAADLKTVRKLSADKEVFRDAVLEFAEGLSIPDFVKAAEQIKSLVESAGIARDYEVKDDGLPSPNA